MLRLIAGLCGVVTLLSLQPAAAQVVTACGASKGYGYFFPGGLLVPQKDVGWRPEAISDGVIVFSRSGGKPKLMTKHAMGWLDVEADGGQVFEIDNPVAGFTTLVVVYSGTGVVEHFLFKLDRAGSGTLVWGTVRPSEMVSKSALMSAQCKRDR